MQNFSLVRYTAGLEIGNGASLVFTRTDKIDICQKPGTSWTNLEPNLHFGLY